MLLQLWQGMVRRFGTETPKLVIIGQRGWKCEEVFDLLDRGDTLKGTVVELVRPVACRPTCRCTGAALSKAMGCN